MNNLILITAAYRLDNLLQIAKSININYDKYNKIFNIYWLICKDQYNSFGDLQKTIDYLNTTNIKYCILDSGKPNQKNYGGDLFNEPLQIFVNENNLENSWIYILDDDNIVHPNLYEVFNICLENKFYNKEIITTINKWDVGHNREINKEIFLLPNSNSLIQEWFLFDPSSVILKYNIVKKYNFYSNEFLYDFNWLNFKVLINEQDNIIWFNEYEHSYGRHVVCSYHNGLVKLDNIKELTNNIDKLNIDILLSNLDIERPQNIPILDNKIKQEILNVIQKYLK